MLIDSPNRVVAILPNRYLKIPKTMWALDVKPLKANDKAPLNQPDYTSTLSWFNGLAIDVYIKYRDGSIVHVPGSIGAERFGHLECCSNLERGRHANFDHESFMDLGGLNDDSPAAYKSMGVSIKATQEVELGYSTVRGVRVNPMTNITHTQIRLPRAVAATRFIFQEYEFRDPSGTYIGDLDVVITTTREQAINVLHPFSHLGMKLTESIIADNDRLAISMLIIDNSKQFAKRYTTVHDQHYQIPSIADPTRPDGLYVLRSGDSNENDQHLYVVSKFHAIADADKLGITRTQREYESIERKQLNEHLEQIRLLQDIVNKDRDRKSRESELERKLQDEIDARKSAERKWEIDLIERNRNREEVNRVNRRKDHIEYVKLGLSALGLLISVGLKIKKT